MTEVLKWAGIVGAIWLAVSILLAVFWGLAGRRIFRKPPVQPRIVRRDGKPISEREAAAVREIIEMDLKMRGRRNGGL